MIALLILYDCFYTGIYKYTVKCKHQRFRLRLSLNILRFVCIIGNSNEKSNQFEG